MFGFNIQPLGRSNWDLEAQFFCQQYNVNFLFDWRHVSEINPLLAHKIRRNYIIFDYILPAFDAHLGIGATFLTMKYILVICEFIFFVLFFDNPATLERFN